MTAGISVLAAGGVILIVLGLLSPAAEALRPLRRTGPYRTRRVARHAGLAFGAATLVALGSWAVVIFSGPVPGEAPLEGAESVASGLLATLCLLGLVVGASHALTLFSRAGAGPAVAHPGRVGPGAFAARPQDLARAPAGRGRGAAASLPDGTPAALEPPPFIELPPLPTPAPLPARAGEPHGERARPLAGTRPNGCG